MRTGSRPQEENRSRSALSPKVATKARWAARSSSVIRGTSGTSRCRRGISPEPPAAAVAGFGRQDQLRLPRPDQVDIDFGQQLGVEQCAVLGAAGIIDRIARAEIVEAIRHAGMLAPRQQQRVDQPVAHDHRPLDAIEFGIDKADIERRVVNHQRRIADEFQEVFDHFGEQRLVGEELAGKAMHIEGLGRHVPLGIDVAVKRLPCRHAVEYLDTADFDQPVAPQRVEAGGFGIENDFAHESLSRNDGESGSPPRHLNSLFENVADSRPHRIEPVRGIHHEIGALALFGVGQLPRQDGVELSAVMLSRARIRSRWISGVVVTTTTASTRFSPPVSNSSGTSTTTTGAPDRSASSRIFAWRRRASDARYARAASSRRDRAPPRAESLLRSTLPSTVVPGNAASIAGAASPSYSLWTAASAS